jgi:predicted transposase YdaD
MKYDQTLKALFLSPPRRLIECLLGAPLAITEMLPTEYSTVQERRADLVARLEDGRLLHLELQSTSEDISWRELDYYSLICRDHGQPPLQIVLYIGFGKMRIPSGIDHENLQFRYRVVDIREMDGEVMLGSDSLEDNLLAILCRLADTREALRRILRRVAALSPERRQDALAQLLILSGLRQLTRAVREEMQAMPITLDIEENSFLKELYEQAKREGEQEGRQEGRQQGRQEGRTEGERLILRRQLERRFGPLPSWALGRIEKADPTQLEAWGLLLLDAHTLEEALD